ncbi:MAG TPA: glycosyltransferase family 9 protein, partial [Gemmataceae bacterium]|nr:glycosyltransferase family 9 protein [Gemmataceae bacterium]
MKLAIFLPNWVGDAVMATPALRVLRQHFAHATILGVLKPYVAGVLHGAPWLDQCLLLTSDGPWSQRWPAVAAGLRRERVDLAILFANTFRSALVAYLGGCRRRVGYVRHGRRFLLTDRLQHATDRRGRRFPQPEIEAYNRLVESVGCPSPSYRMELFTTIRDEAAAVAVWRQAGFERYPEVVCLNPGGAFGSAKHWPTDYFATLARELADRRGSGVLVLCGPAERETARQIAREARSAAVHTLADQPLSLGLTKACV